MKSSDPEPAPDHPSTYILVVEDDVLLRFVLSEWLRSLHYVVHEAANTDEASRLLASPLVDTDLVITDIMLPGMIDGLDLRNYIRRAFPELPVIMVSGQPPASVKKDPNFFHKPYDLQKIADRIAQLLSERKGS